ILDVFHRKTLPIGGNVLTTAMVCQVYSCRSESLTTQGSGLGVVLDVRAKAGTYLSQSVRPVHGVGQPSGLLPGFQFDVVIVDGTTIVVVVGIAKHEEVGNSPTCLIDGVQRYRPDI